jgi:hypothetical protein
VGASGLWARLRSSCWDWTDVLLLLELDGYLVFTACCLVFFFLFFSGAAVVFFFLGAITLLLIRVWFFFRLFFSLATNDW